jgi:hypothetical protein
VCCLVLCALAPLVLFAGEVALTRAADEEHLQILHVWRN